MAKKAKVLLQVILFMFIVVQNGECIWLNLPKSGRKCVTEEIHTNVVVLADYVVISDVHIHPTPSITTKVTSPYGNILHHKENATHGQFAFTTSEAGQYLMCFWADDPNQGGALSVNIDWKTGIAAKDWDSVARREKIDGVELELRKLEEAVEAIYNNLLYLKGREAEIREVSEATNSRVAFYSMLSLGICIAASFGQLWYLTHFFQKKKLI